MFAIQVSVICAVVAFTTAHPLVARATDGCSTEGTNINTVIQYLRNEAFMKGFDPFPISPVPSQDIEFRYQLTNHKGTLQLKQGLATGLSTLHLSDVSNGEITCQGNNIVASLLLDFDDITTSWAYELDAGKWNPAGYLTVKTLGTQVALDIALNLDTALLSLQRLVVVAPGSAEISFSGMGNIEKAVTDPIKQVYGNNITPLITEEIVTLVKELVNNTPPLFTPAATSSTTPWETTSELSTPTWGPTTDPSTPTLGPTTDSSTPTWGPTTDPSTPTLGPTTDSSTPTWGPTTNPSTPTWGPTTDSSTPTWGPTTDLSTPTWGPTTDLSTPTWGPTTDLSTPTWGPTTDTSNPTWGPTTDLSTPTWRPTTDSSTPSWETTINPSTPSWETTIYPSTPSWETTTDASSTPGNVK